jgi:hypothetical protein
MAAPGAGTGGLSKSSHMALASASQPVPPSAKLKNHSVQRTPGRPLRMAPITSKRRFPTAPEAPTCSGERSRANFATFPKDLTSAPERTTVLSQDGQIVARAEACLNATGAEQDGQVAEIIVAPG